MMRLIDADALWEQISQHRPFDALALIEDAQTVDSIKHGHWTKSNGWYWCSVCGDHCGEDGANYCPNCGAEMDDE